tara:strand:+ start:522 stop:725 length:204 start_codon:yes stop_codon:yes gene_type:complete
MWVEGLLFRSDDQGVKHIIDTFPRSVKWNIFNEAFCQELLIAHLHIRDVAKELLVQLPRTIDVRAAL